MSRAGVGGRGFAGARGYYGRAGLYGRAYTPGRSGGYYNIGRFANYNSRVGRNGVVRGQNFSPSSASYLSRNRGAINRPTRFATADRPYPSRNTLAFQRAEGRPGQRTVMPGNRVSREGDLARPGRNHLGRQIQNQNGVTRSQAATPSFNEAQRRHRSNCGNDKDNDNGHNRCDHHGRKWWWNHCDSIILVNWGYWGWWNGWWYPAWGYDSYYDYYDYDGPIYGYDGLPPDEIVANVQFELQRLGYYDNAVDGTLGPVTQQALRRYQRDRRIAVTGAIDPPTVKSLGLN